MLRNVYLEGELGARYGQELTLDADNVRDVFRLLEANYPDVKKYLIECHEAGIGFTCKSGEEFLQEQLDLITPLTSSDLIISPVPSGSKSGVGKVLAAVAIIAVMIAFPETFLVGGEGAVTSSLFAEGAVLNTLGQVTLLVATNLAIAGISQIMAPDPSVDKDEPQSYLFNGGQQNIVEGDPVPVLYGELRIPGRPIGFGTISSNQNAMGVGLGDGLGFLGTYNGDVVISIG